jgi:hypothetical protein
MSDDEKTMEHSDHWIGMEDSEIFKTMEHDHWIMTGWYGDQ